MNPKDLATTAKNTWCPGCGNFSILSAMRSVLAELDGEGYPIENVVLVSGIGCHAKIVDYMNVNSFYSIHGRTLPAASAIKIANPDLKVICFSGDGDSLAEGLDHLIFAAKRNIDLTMILHDNRVYGLTTGQYTPSRPCVSALHRSRNSRSLALSIERCSSRLSELRGKTMTISGPSGSRSRAASASARLRAARYWFSR